MKTMNEKGFIMFFCSAFLMTVVFAFSLFMKFEGALILLVLVPRGLMALSWLVIAFLSWRNFCKRLLAEFNRDEKKLYDLKTQELVLSNAMLLTVVICWSPVFVAEACGFVQSATWYFAFKAIMIGACLIAAIHGMITCHERKTGKQNTAKTEAFPVQRKEITNPETSGN